jgi:hypothetical protein
MNLDDVMSQIEDELEWRQSELRLLKNQVGALAKVSEKLKYRKALVVMLYSHFEGFSKKAFSIYLTAINQENLDCSLANEHLAAASLDRVFGAYENRDLKCEIFRGALPEDGKLHRFARQVDLVIQLDELFRQKLVLPDEIADTESNLKPIVLRKILFRLGFKHDAFESYEGSIHQLLNKRNNVAHGVERGGVTAQDYDDLERKTFRVMIGLKNMLWQSLKDKHFLIKKAVPPASAPQPVPVAANLPPQAPEAAGGNSL